MLLNPFTYHAPTTLEEACKLHGELPDNRLLAGGTFLIKTLKSLKKKGMSTPRHIISLKNISELSSVKKEWDMLTIGAMTTLTTLYESAQLTGDLAVIPSVCRNIGTTTIRNMATIGGNLACRYTWTEFPAVMLCLEAALHFFDKDGKEEIVTAEDFFKNGAKTEKILAFVSMKRDKETCCIYKRISQKSPVDVPLVSLCIRGGFKNNRFHHVHVAVNNGIDFARRDNRLENFLNGHTAKDSTPEESLHHIDAALYDANDDYKKQISRALLREAVRELREACS